MARQRRKLVGERAKCSEKYPLAANRVVLEFKLRREKGCKVSKLWIKKKMKAKIESTMVKRLLLNSREAIVGSRHTNEKKV